MKKTNEEDGKQKVSVYGTSFSVTSTSNSEPLSDYHRGFIDGMSEHAYWKDGVQYVGNMNKILDEVIDKYISALER